MAQWKETLEPYIKVQERIHTAPLNPTAGEDLIIGATLISDAGPSVPTLITSQSEFLATYASKDLTEDYIKTLDKLYGDGNDTIASTMWLNAYRLAGSGNMLICRAFKGNNIYFAKPLSKSDGNAYILKDGQMLKKVGEHVKFVVDWDLDKADHGTDGWAIAINEVGVVGNLTTDDGAQYDYFVQNLQELVDYLNDTPKFFSPSYHFYSDERGENEIAISSDGKVSKAATSVIFDELYIGVDFIDETDGRCTLSADQKQAGLVNMVVCQEDWTYSNANQKLLDLDQVSDFTDVPFYATNAFNSSTDLKLRIRRFNHDAVVTKELSQNDANAKGDSPVIVLTSVLDTFEKAKDSEGNLPESILERDYYELAILDPSVSGQPEYYNIGNIYGRGDMTEDELNALIKMIQVQLPDNMLDLGLDYYNWLSPNKKSGWFAVAASEIPADTEVVNCETVEELDEISNPNAGDYAVVGKKSIQYYIYRNRTQKWQPTDIDTIKATLIATATTYESVAAMNEAAGVQDGALGKIGDVFYKKNGNTWEETTIDQIVEDEIDYAEADLDTLNEHVKSPKVGDYAAIGRETAGTYYEYKVGVELEDLPVEEIYVDLSIDPKKYKILNVSDTDLLKAMDKIAIDEVYVTEGLTDLGNTQPIFQSYLCNMAINENYFYPISTVNSTNYLAIANSINRISKDHYKLYAMAPWDVDTGNVGFKFYASPSVLYWEAVNRNRGLVREFASVFGQTNGLMQYQKPVAEFNKKTRQLLLSKRINTVMWNTQTQAWNMNDNYTKQNENNIMSDEANSRLAIRISKAMPILLRQFIGHRINDILYENAYSVIDYWFKSTIIPLAPYGIDDYRITIADINTDEDRRANRMRVLVEVRFERSLKYVQVYHDLFDVGMEFDGQI